MSSLVQRAREIHNRLRNPANGVPDHGIDLSRKSIPSELPVLVANSKSEIIPLTKSRRGMHPKYIIKRRFPKFEDAEFAVCAHFGFEPAELRGASRVQHVTHARQVLYYVARTMTLMSLTDIGRELGHRDHSSVHHGARKIERLVHEDAEFEQVVQGIKREVHKRFTIRNNIYCFDEREF